MSQEKYKEEYEKYKHIQIDPGFYLLKNTFIKYEILDISEEKVKIRTLSSDNIHIKTLHWCRKNLTKDEK